MVEVGQARRRQKDSPESEEEEEEGAVSVSVIKGWWKWKVEEGVVVREDEEGRAVSDACHSSEQEEEVDRVLVVECWF